MDDLLFSLVLLGVIAIITFAILILIKLILKKGISVKKSLGIMGISFVVVIVSLVLSPNYDNEETAATSTNEENGKSIEKPDSRPSKEKEVDKEDDKEELKEVESDYMGSIDDATVEGSAELSIYEVFKNSYDDPNEIVTDIKYDEDNKELTATTIGREGLNDESTRKNFYEDTANALEKISEDERIDEVELNITFPMKDKNGNVKDDVVMTTVMTRDEMDEINWNNFDPEKLPDVAQGLTLHPTFHLK